jgi:TonB family protein
VVALLDAQGNRLAEASGTLERTFYRKSMEELSPRPLNPFPHWPGVPVAGKNGYGEPKCVSCPMSHYTSDARAAGFQGTELVYLLVGEDGSVKDVFVAEGLPGGLSDQTVSTLKTWRFEPVHGPDGKPVTVQVPVDAVFQLIREKSRCLSCPPVRYTKEARKAKVEGTLTLKLLVDKEGNVREVNVEQGLPHGLTEQAVDTVKKWKFKPFLGPDGNPIEKSLDIELNFRLPR